MDPILNEIMILALKLEENAAYAYQLLLNTPLKSSHQDQSMQLSIM